ncbi:hypothetical protein HD554DRAFT_2120216 [Boletus coccyginus]|nr:hypothetical protein HD554DRAFT_2120216 [Boletus coccyginus]
MAAIPRLMVYVPSLLSSGLMVYVPSLLSRSMSTFLCLMISVLLLLFSITTLLTPSVQ